MASIEAEQAVIGAILVDPAAALPAVAQTGLSPQQFHEQDCAAIFAAAQDLHRRGEAVDVVTVWERLKHMGEPGRAVPLQQLNELFHCVPSASNAAQYARIVTSFARRRQVEAIARALQLAAASAELPPEQFDARCAELLDDLATTSAPARESGALPVQWAEDLGEAAEVPPQLVEGVLTVGGLSSVNGQPNAGKSYIAGHLAMCVASGREWLGRRVVDKGWALYVAAEGAASVRARWQADRKHFGHTPGRIALVAQSLNMLDPSPDVDALIATARAVSQRAGGGPGLVVIDTVARVMVGGDENTAIDMGRLIGAADRVRETTGAHVLLIHHMGKDAARGARGHSSLKAALDTEIEVTVDEATKTHYAKVTKQRDLPSKGETFACKFIPVELGVDQWGNPITACAVEPSDLGIAPPAPKRLTASQQAVLGYLAGRDGGARRGAIAEALAPQGTSQSSTYGAIKQLLMAGVLIDVQGVVYAPK